MINLVRDLNPDLMVVAGDVFHQRQPNQEALSLFHETLNRLTNLGIKLVFLAGVSDDFKSLHLDGRWVREAGIHLFEDATQVLSPLSVTGPRDSFETRFWCLPYPRGSDLGQNEQHPALLEHKLVEKVVQRLDPTEVNVLMGYAWAQDCGRRPELGHLIQPGGQPLEKRMLEFFDVAALGGRHEPLRLGTTNTCYSGSLLCYEPDAEERERSVTVYDIVAKGEVYIEHYSLRPRRNLRVLEGSWEELMAQGGGIRSDDLLVLRSGERDLTPEQRADLRILSPNVVSVELPSPFEAAEEEKSEAAAVPAVVSSFLDFCSEVGEFQPDEECLEVLLELEQQL